MKVKIHNYFSSSIICFGLDGVLLLFDVTRKISYSIALSK